jgi:hypothetical protein
MACVTVKHYTEAFRRLDPNNVGQATMDYIGFVSAPRPRQACAVGQAGMIADSRWTSSWTHPPKRRVRRRSDLEHPSGRYPVTIPSAHSNPYLALAHQQTWPVEPGHAQ